MDVMILEDAIRDCSSEKQKMFKAIQFYCETITNLESNRDEIKEACNEAIRSMSKVIDKQAESIVALVMTGQILGEYICGKPKKLLS